MKLAKLILVTWFVSLSGLFAQGSGVSVDLALDQDQFLPDEELRVAVKISNRSGQTLTLGKDANWLTFSVESRDSFIVPKLENPPVTGEFSLESSLVGTKRVNITPYFNFSKPGGYRVTAVVKLPWGEEIISKPKTFEITSGTRLQEVEFGVPREGNNGIPETRHYVLQQAIYLKQMRLYLRLTDASGAKTLKLFPLAPMTSFTKVEAQLDRFSNFHVLSQTGARSFNYCVINPEGQIITRQTHDYSENSRPVLKYNSEGRVRVFGGAQRITPTDLPAPQEALTQTNVNPEK